MDVTMGNEMDDQRKVRMQPEVVGHVIHRRQGDGWCCCWCCCCCWRCCCCYSKVQVSLLLFLCHVVQQYPHLLQCHWNSCSSEARHVRCCCCCCGCCCNCWTLPWQIHILAVHLYL